MSGPHDKNNQPADKQVSEKRQQLNAQLLGQIEGMSDAEIDDYQYVLFFIAENDTPEIHQSLMSKKGFSFAELRGFIESGEVKS